EAPSVLAGSNTPVAIPVPKLAAFARGVGTHLCGVTSAHDAVCWGRGTFGQLGGGVAGAVGNPALTVFGSISWRELAIQRLTSCGMSQSGVAYCWGTNQRGELGIASIPIN